MYTQFRKVKVNSIKKAAVALTAALMLAGATGITVSNAQQTGTSTPTAPTAPNGDDHFNPGLALVCSTTNYTDVAAQALGMTSPALRLALVSGQSLSAIAKSKSVDVATVQTALKTAFEADLTQAVTDGLLTQAQADQMKSRLDSAPAAAATAPAAAPTAAATPAVGDGNRPGGPRGPIGPMGGGAGFGFMRIADHNTVNTFQVAAKTIGVSCADLVKAIQGGQSLAQVATSKNVTAQAVIDALTTAEKAAVAQDVTEGLITQAQADKLTANLTTRITNEVNNAPGPRDGRGPGFGPGGNQQPGQHDGRGPGQPGQQPPAATPAATAAAGTSS